jgi:hypothetical protein
MSSALSTPDRTKCVVSSEVMTRCRRGSTLSVKRSAAVAW